jgi:hypothetical protein
MIGIKLSCAMAIVFIHEPIIIAISLSGFMVLFLFHHKRIVRTTRSITANNNSIRPIDNSYELAKSFEFQKRSGHKS